MATNNSAKQSAIIWGILAIALAIFACVFNSSPLVTSASMFAKVLAVLAGAVAGTVCALIGDALRRAVRSDMVITNGGFFSLLGTKLFWAVGPQVVGLLIGVFLAETLVLK